MDRDDDEFEFSPFTGPVHDDGAVVELKIYRFASPGEQWQLEVVDRDGGSTVWVELFDTDGEAFEAFLDVMKDEGIHSFLRSAVTRH